MIDWEADDDGWRASPEASLAVCWLLAACIVDRHPGRLAARRGRFEPAPDMYDVVEILDVVEKRHVAFLNAAGTGVNNGMRWPKALVDAARLGAWLDEFDRRSVHAIARVEARTSSALLALAGSTGHATGN